MRRTRDIACERRNYRLKHKRTGAPILGRSFIFEMILVETRQAASWYVYTTVDPRDPRRQRDSFFFLNLPNFILFILLSSLLDRAKPYLGTGIPAFRNPWNIKKNQDVTYWYWRIGFFLYSSRDNPAFAKLYIIPPFLVRSHSHSVFVFCSCHPSCYHVVLYSAFWSVLRSLRTRGQNSYYVTFTKKKKVNEIKYHCIFSCRLLHNCYS